MREAVILRVIGPLARKRWLPAAPPMVSMVAPLSTWVLCAMFLATLMGCRRS